RLGGFLELAELQHEAAIGRIDDVEAARQPDDDEQGDKDADAAAEELRIELDRRPAIAAVATAVVAAFAVVHHAGELAVEIPPEFFEVGRPLVRAPVAAVAAIVVTAAIAPLRVVQRHE